MKLFFLLLFLCLCKAYGQTDEADTEWETDTDYMAEYAANFDVSKMQYTCDKIQPYRRTCITGERSQFTLRWHWNSEIGKCAPYAWGYCRGEDAIRSHPSLRSFEACVDICGK